MKRASRRSVTLAPALAGLVALAALASACGGASEQAKKSGGTAREEAPPAAAVQINQVPREKLQDGGTLRWPLSQMPPNFNASHIDGSLADNSAVMSALLPRPFNFDATAQPSPNRDYVESAELTAKTPKQVVTYRINPKAAWYDGSPITVADFEAHWKANNGTDESFKVSSTQGYDKIESVVAGSSERQVIVTYATPYADWQGLFSGLYPVATNRDPAVFNDGWKERPLTTAGPFKLGSVDPTAKTITLVRNEKWWGAPARLEQIIYRVIDADAQIDSLANGEIDFIDVGPDVNKLQRAQGTAGIELRKAGGPNFRHLTVNGTSEVLADVRVRRALAMGIDRDTIARAQLGPLGVPPVPLDNHIFMANQKGYERNAGDLAKADPAAAARLLDEAGWKLEGEVRRKEGKDLVVRFVIPANVATSKLESELVQGMLAPIGVKVDIQVVPLGEFFKNYVTPGNFDLTVFSWLGGVFPISSSKSIYAKPEVGDDGALVIQQNYARVGSDELDALFDQATAEFDPTTAVALGNRIDRMIWDEVHSLTLYQRPEITAVKSAVANFGAFGFATTIYEDIGFEKP